MVLDKSCLLFDDQAIHGCGTKGTRLKQWPCFSEGNPEAVFSAHTDIKKVSLSDVT